MNFNQLNYFISVAKYLNFTKAAQHHYISQTAISRQIIALEKEVGIELFYRNKRSVNLTAAGQVFFTEANRIVSILDHAINNATLVKARPTGILKVGFQGIAEREFLPFWVKTFLSAYPNIELKLFKQTNGNMQEIISNDQVDILFRLSHTLDITPKLSWKVICKVPDSLCAVVSLKHPIVKKRRIQLDQLENEKFVFFDNKSNPLGFNLILSKCRQAGFTPNIISESTSVESLLLLVEAEVGITILPQCYQSHATRNVRFIKLDNNESHPPTLIAVWDPNNLNPAVPLFLNIADKKLHSSLIAKG
ncbi:MAG: transcriptional regulator AlsR family [Firmicutes bacterium]|nr:transcriptional regulator AlsR family [Bacillota bacterium]